MFERSSDRQILFLTRYDLQINSSILEFYQHLFCYILSLSHAFCVAVRDWQAMKAY